MKISDSNWLAPHEKEEACERLLRFGLIKWDNNRNLPLKSGGKTDIYVNLREARSNPEAIKYISWLLENPLRRLRAERFVEIPDSVSCFAGPISVSTGLPYLTIREKEKEGRVSKAKVIGDAKYGEKVAIFDDVITDGASKISPIHECRKMNLDLLPLVVLVDRQQGWKKTFSDHGIDLDIWAGMALHDIRKYMIERGIMDRCDPKMEAENSFIIGLDGKPWDEVLPIVDILRTTGTIWKVNDLMFNEGIKNIIPDLQVYGRVMADLKGFDIPNTLKNISKHFLTNPPWAVTVHATGHRKMMEAVKNVLRGTPTLVLGVTVLTSFDEKTCMEVYRRRPIKQVEKLAEIAHSADADGLVCSPEEVKFLKTKYPSMIFVTPGVRSPGKDAGDQKRVGTPAKAIKDGADYLVMARQILEAVDPVAEVKRLLDEEIMPARKG